MSLRHGRVMPFDYEAHVIDLKETDLESLSGAIRNQIDVACYYMTWAIHWYRNGCLRAADNNFQEALGTLDDSLTRIKQFVRNVPADSDEHSLRFLTHQVKWNKHKIRQYESGLTDLQSYRKSLEQQRMIGTAA